MGERNRSRLWRIPELMAMELRRIFKPQRIDYERALTPEELRAVHQHLQKRGD